MSGGTCSFPSRKLAVFSVQLLFVGFFGAWDDVPAYRVFFVELVMSVCCCTHLFSDCFDSLGAEGDDVCGGSDVAFVFGAAFVFPVWVAFADGVGAAFTAVCAVVFFDLCCDDDPEGGSSGVWVGHSWLVFLFFPAFDDGFAEVASGFVEALVVVVVGSACQVAGVLGVADAADGLVFVCMFHQFSPESVGGSLGSVPLSLLWRGPWFG